MNLFSRVLIVLILCFCFGCQTAEKPALKIDYMRFVGDIESDVLLDDSNFTTCLEDGPVMQYFNTGEGFRYKGERPALVNAIKELYKPTGNLLKQTGYIRIRFIINCKGEAGMFRVLTSDENFKATNFDTSITKQLVDIVSNLDGWQKMVKNESALDYYMYIIVKLENGIIKEILP